MSKRENSSSVKWLLECGYLPEAIANYLILLGNKTPTEIFTIQEAATWFDISLISKSPAKFDIAKLAQINREHIKLASNSRLCELFKLDEKFCDLIRFYTQESSLIPEIKEKIEKIYSKKDINEFKNEVEILKNLILNMKIPENFADFKQNLMQKSGLKGKNFFMPLRLLLTGQEHGPELSELYLLIKNDILEIVNL